MSDFLALPAFAGDGAVNVVIESPRGSTVKFKYDGERRVITVARPLVSGLAYPYDWGFVPSTRSADGDPVDAFVMWDAQSYPGVVISARPIGVLRVEQTNPESHKRERNDRIAVVPMKAPRLSDVRNVFDFSERVRQELEHFFMGAVAFEKKDVRLLGWAGPKEAMSLVESALTDSQPHALR